ncbi:glutamate racemase [Halosquirtibacter xylanolyticus]|uniref:glutamate racemase n=1 Tax=Halosquirtibacter xylanolyticus TaxID=3374599 RepID=UPI0037499B45|nr:glutamate racemase [Prolixibacteraceae bacterium]
MGPIGVFDSGYGGLTVLKSIVDVLPKYDYLYLGDNARNPYGSRSFEVIYQYTKEAVDYLFSQGCELVILACNTASAKALRTIQQNDLHRWGPNKRVLGVIRPSVEYVIESSRTGVIGVLGTEGTVKSESYPLEISKFSLKRNMEVFQQACPMWVPLIENQSIHTSGAAFFVTKNVEELLQQSANIDTILLGCTHYPLIKPIIELNIPNYITVLSQGDLVAESLKSYLERHTWMDSQCSKNGVVSFLTTESSTLFDERATQFYGEQVNSQQIVLG